MMMKSSSHPDIISSGIKIGAFRLQFIGSNSNEGDFILNLCLN